MICNALIERSKALATPPPYRTPLPPQYKKLPPFDVVYGLIIINLILLSLSLRTISLSSREFTILYKTFILLLGNNCKGSD